jgi:murein DD-endopeptidase MepM/ murein hydrolase activator NlpD
LARSVPRFLGLALLPAALSGQAPAVTWDAGPPPRQGSFAYLSVTPGSERPMNVHGTLDGVPLQFEPVDGGRFTALAGVALDAGDSVSVAVRLAFPAGRMERLEVRLPVVDTVFPNERLSVDPRFTRRPDSALAARIARENAQAREVSREALRTRRLWRDAFAPPREAPITSRYGTGRVFNQQVQSRHLGVDFDGAMGDPVRAANRGVVALVGDFYYAGRVIYLNHGAGVVTAYLHLSETLVTPGDTVEISQVIGKVGRSGRVTGPHLHWAAKYGIASLDGATLLALPPPPPRRD